MMAPRIPRTAPITLLRLALAGALYGAICAGSTAARADDHADAASAAEAFHADFDGNRINQLFDRFAGQFVLARVTKDAFVSQLAVLRNQLGGKPSSRQTIQEQTAPDPATGQPLYSFRYKVHYPAVAVYEDLTFVKESEGSWKLYGIYFNPIPSD